MVHVLNTHVILVKVKQNLRIEFLATTDYKLQLYGLQKMGPQSQVRYNQIK